MEGLGGIILAAGMSSRMKEFKPMLKIGDETMISRVVSMMERAGAAPVAIITGYMREKLENGLKHRGVLFIHNDRFGQTQMLDSLMLGFDAIGGKCERLLISPADVPLVLPKTVEALLRIDGQFVRPVHRGAPGHPVLLKTEIIPLIRQYEGAGGLRGAAESSHIEIVEMETGDSGVTMDADTTEDYERLIAFYRAGFA